MTTSLDPVPAVRATIRAYLQLELALSRARAVQWDPAPRTSGAGVARHASGGYSDPTADTATDNRRGQVSAQVRHAENLLRKMHDLLTAEARHLDDAVAMWEGKPK